MQIFTVRDVWLLSKQKPEARTDLLTLLLTDQGILA